MSSQPPRHLGEAARHMQNDPGVLAQILSIIQSTPQPPSSESSFTLQSSQNTPGGLSTPSQNSIVPATPSSSQTPISTVEQRADVVAGQRVKRKSIGKENKRKRTTDDVFNELVTETDEQQYRRLRHSRLEHFLYGEQKDSRVATVMQQIMGSKCDPDSKSYDETRRQLLQDHRRFQNETLNNAIKLCTHMSQGTAGDSEIAPWTSLLDTRNAYGDEFIIEKISNDFSWDRFYQVWYWIRKYIDAEASKPLARYYCRQIWIQVILETIRYMRIKITTPREATNAHNIRMERYKAMPAHKNFNKVCREMFVEKSPGVKRAYISKRKVVSTESALAHVVMEAPPDSDDGHDSDADGRVNPENTEGDGNGNGSQHDNRATGGNDES